MTIIHHGGRFGVTGSCHELKVSPSASILVDCGLTQGAETVADNGKSSAAFITFPIADIKAVVLTHIHIDHCGRLPYLLGAGYRGKIYCSEASALLLPLVLEDALKLGITRDENLISGFLRALKKHLVPLPYGKWQKIGTWDGVAANVRLQQAGHIMGSAIVELDTQGPETHDPRPEPNLSGFSNVLSPESRVVSPGSDFSCQQSSAGPRPGFSSPKSDGRGLRSQRVVFSGDLGAPDTPLLPDPTIPERADILLLESTYGDRLHEDRKQRKERLRKVIRRALQNRGAILIPAFSIGRTQELLYELEQLIAEYRDQVVAADLPWDDLEIVVDSPMAQRVTEIYSAMKELWDSEAKDVVATGRHPLSFDQMTVISSHEEHLQTVAYLKKTARPSIVIAAGGMCSGGRIVNYLKSLLSDDRTDVVFIGYQAEGTPGREIQTTGTGGVVALDGRNYSIRAGIHTLGGYSAHADQRNLLDFVAAMPERPGRVRLVHGEAGARRALARKLRDELGVLVEE